MSANVSSTCRSAYYQLRQLRPVIRSLSVNAAKTAVQAFVNTPGLLQQSHERYCWRTGAMASSCPERRRTSDHRRSTARPHIACSPAAALASSWPTSSVQAGSASVQSVAWASPIVLDGRLSTTVVWCRHMRSATDPYVPRRSCVRSRRTTSVERFAECRSASVSLTSPLDSSDGL